MKQAGREIMDWWQRRVGIKLAPLLNTVRLAGLALAALALWGFYEIAEEVLEKETDALDTHVLLTIHQWQTPGMDRLMLLLTAIGQPTSLVIVSLLLSGFLLWRGRKAETMALLIAAVGAVGLNSLLKALFERDRPELWQRTVAVQYYSFPSGHAMVSMVIYGLIGYLLAQHFRRHRLFIYGWTLSLIGAIGFSRLYLGVHWFTDVIAGYAAGFVWLQSCILSLEIWQQRTDRPKSQL